MSADDFEIGPVRIFPDLAVTKIQNGFLVYTAAGGVFVQELRELHKLMDGMWAPPAPTPTPEPTPAADEPQKEVCPRCEGGGWLSYGIGGGIDDPHFRECEECHNPEGIPSP